VTGRTVSGGDARQVPEQLSLDGLLGPVEARQAPCGGGTRDGAEGGGGTRGGDGAGAGAARREVRYSAREIAELLGRHAPTPEQVAVIEAPVEPLLVVAGAGSGKTETMAARVVWLVANDLVSPDAVLGLTFTRKAAAELADRIRARLRALHRRGLTPEPEPVTVSTYHAYAASVLADHGLRLGVEPGARVLGEAGSWQLVDELVERWDGDMDGVDASRRSVVDAVLALAGECAEHLVELADVEAAVDAVLERIASLPRVVGDAAPGPPAVPVARIAERLATRRRLLPLVGAYAERKRAGEVIDFGDQIALAARLAREVPAVGAGERERYRVVLLDEYQDTSHAQLVLLRALFGSGHPVTAVGDPHQSIYGWRGASAGNLQRFPEDFPALRAAPGPAPSGEGPARVVHLSTSWRNDRAVLAVANRVGADLRRPPPWLPAARHVDVPPLLACPTAGPGLVLLGWHPTVEEEAAAVADLAAAAWRETTSVAVLCRTRAQFPLVEAALRGRGLPVEVVGLGGLLHVPEIADLRATLEVIHDPTRGDAMMRLLTGAAWGLGAPDLDALGAWSGVVHRESPLGRRVDRGTAVEADVAEERSLLEALDDLPPEDWRGPAGERLSAEGRRRLTRLADVLRGVRARAGLPLPDLVLEVERALLLDVEVAARSDRDPATARAHLDAFLDVVSSFAGGGERPTLGALLGWLAAAENRERGLECGVTEGAEAVQLLTVHGAKGLEWDVVAVTGLVEGTFPSGHAGHPPVQSNGWLTDHGALPYPLRGDADGLPEWRVTAAASQQELVRELETFRSACGAHEVSEERRLGYVAITRARHRLALTGAVWGDGARPRQPSRFLVEARELAEDPGSGVEVGAWAEQPEDGAGNPREALTRPVGWPVDPLGERRPAVAEGADLVRSAMAALRADGPAAAVPGADLPGAAVPGEGVVPGHRADGAARVAGWAREVEVLLAERDAARVARAEVELPAHLSASRIVALAADPVALAARLRRPLPEPPSPHARRGSSFHTWLERRFAAAALVDVDELPGAADDDLPEDGLERLQEAFLASEWAHRIPEAVEVSVETPVAGLVVRGRIDAVFRGPGGRWDVVDWKTGAPPSGAETGARAVQLAVYRLAWARLQGVPVDRVGAAFFYAARGRTVRPVDLLDEAGLERLVEETAPRVTGET